MADHDDPAPLSFQQEHVRRYRATDGADGYDWNGAPCLLLTTVGARTGHRRTTPLLFGRDEDRVVIVASRKGAADHPQWYLNLVADPSVEVQILADRFAAVASTVGGPERERLWRIMVDIWPDYDAYRAKTERTIPVVALDRVDRHRTM